MLINQVDFFKTLYFNLKLFKLSDALKFPLIIGKRTKVELKRGDIILPDKISLGLISFGIGGSSDLYYFESKRNYLGVKNGGTIIFKGKAHFAVHTSCYSAGGKIIFGEKFSSNVGCKFSSIKGIEFGNECLLGGNVIIRDSDGHKVFDMYCKQERYHISEKEIKIGNHVWIGNQVSILKGVVINEGCIIGYGTILTKSIKENNCLIGGVPGSVLRNNISWKR